MTTSLDRGTVTPVMATVGMREPTSGAGGITSSSSPSFSSPGGLSAIIAAAVQRASIPLRTAADLAEELPLAAVEDVALLGVAHPEPVLVTPSSLDSLQIKLASESWRQSFQVPTGNSGEGERVIDYYYYYYYMSGIQ